MRNKQDHMYKLSPGEVLTVFCDVDDEGNQSGLTIRCVYDGDVSLEVEGW